MQNRNLSTYFELYDNLKGLKPSITLEDKNYTLRYFDNPNESYYHLFMHTKVYDKMTNENIEKQGILLRSWNPITKRGERYIFRKGEEGDGELNLKKIYLPHSKTIFVFSSTRENVNDEESYKLAQEIISICPHKDVEIKITNL
jgi:hypothetical protein